MRYLVLVLAGGSGSHAFLAVPFVCFGQLHIVVRCLAPVSWLYCGNGCRAGLHIHVFRGRSCLAPRHGFSAITMQLFCAGPSSLAQYFLIPVLPRSAAANRGFCQLRGVRAVGISCLLGVYRLYGFNARPMLYNKKKECTTSQQHRIPALHNACIVRCFLCTSRRPPFHGEVQPELRLALLLLYLFKQSPAIVTYAFVN